MKYFALYTFFLYDIQHLPITFFIALKLSTYVRALIPHQIVADVITYVLCTLMSDGQIQAVFTGYCNICTACNTINLSLVVHLCTSVSGQHTVQRIYILSFVYALTCEPAGHRAKYSQKPLCYPEQHRRGVRCAVGATNQWHSSAVKAFFYI